WEQLPILCCALRDGRRSRNLNRMRRTCLILLLLALLAPHAAACDLPADNATLGRQSIAEILAGQAYPATSSFTQRIDFIDFSAHGQPFTQVVVTLTPD